MSAARRAAPSTRAGTRGYPPYDVLTFDVPVLHEGDVNDRVWIRILEVGQSLSLIDQILDGLPGRFAPQVDAAASTSARASRWSKGSAATSSLGADRCSGARRALPFARPVLVPMAAARSGRSKATSLPTSRCAINRSTVPIRDTICRAQHAQDSVSELVQSPADRAAPPAR